MSHYLTLRYFSNLTIHTIFLIVALLCAAVVLIGVYHTSIFLISKAGTFLFYTFMPSAALISASYVAFIRQPVHSLLCLIAVFIATAMLYIVIGAEFLAFLFLIVYVGAIAILFLFVIMLLQLKKYAAALTIITFTYSFISVPTGAVSMIGTDDIVSTTLSSFFALSNILALTNEILTAGYLTDFVMHRFHDILQFSTSLYTKHSFLFYVSSLLLLTAILGAIILATSASEQNMITASIQSNKNGMQAKYSIFL
jgi:NADH-quinone oxidoreductase subunit J